MSFPAHRRALACLILALSTTVSAVPAVAQADTAAADAAYVPTQTFDVVSIHESKDDFSRSVRMGGPNSPHSKPRCH